MLLGKNVSSVESHFAISPKTMLAFSLSVVSQALLYNEAPHRVRVTFEGSFAVVLEWASLKESYLVISNVYVFSVFSRYRHAVFWTKLSTGRFARYLNTCGPRAATLIPARGSLNWTLSAKSLIAGVIRFSETPLSAQICSLHEIPLSMLSRGSISHSCPRQRTYVAGPWIPQEVVMLSHRQVELGLTFRSLSIVYGWAHSDCQDRSPWSFRPLIWHSQYPDGGTRTSRCRLAPYSPMSVQVHRLV